MRAEVEFASRSAARAAFGGLEAPDPEAILGRWEADFAGGRLAVRLGRVQVGLTALRGWTAKEIVDAEHGRNWVRRRGEELPVLEMAVSTGPSLLDGGPVVALSYPPDAPLPFRWIRDELRWLVPGAEMLGMGIVRLGRGRLRPTPFLLSRP